MAYLTAQLIAARVGGGDVYVELTDDDGDTYADPDVEEFLLAQVDSIVEAFARRAGYTVPLAITDLEPVRPFLLDIANYKAKTRGSRVASEDDRKLYDDAMKIMEEIAAGDFKLPSYQTTAPVEQFGFDTPDTSNSPAPFFSRSSLRGF